MYFNSSRTLLFHFNTFTAAVAEVPQLIVPRVGNCTEGRQGRGHPSGQQVGGRQDRDQGLCTAAYPADTSRIAQTQVPEGEDLVLEKGQLRAKCLLGEDLVKPSLLSL